MHGHLKLLCRLDRETQASELLTVRMRTLDLVFIVLAQLMEIMETYLYTIRLHRTGRSPLLWVEEILLPVFVLTIKSILEEDGSEPVRAATIIMFHSISIISILLFFQI